MNKLACYENTVLNYIYQNGNARKIVYQILIRYSRWHSKWMQAKQLERS